MNAVVFLICSGVGFLLGRYLPEGAWAAYGSILISYHLFLGWLLITADRKVAFSLPIFSTIVTHSACLIVVVGFAVGRHYIPFFGIIRYLLPAMAPFERNWLFSGGKAQQVSPAPPPVSTIIDSTAEDDEEWLRHLSTRHPLSVKRGMTVRQEYEQFMLARVNNRAMEASKDQPA